MGMLYEESSMSVSRPKYTKEQHNLEWLKYLCSATYQDVGEDIPLANYWIIQPSEAYQDTVALKSDAVKYLDNIRLILFCDITDDAYQQAIAPHIDKRGFNIVGFDGTSFEVMSDLILKLDFSRIQKIGIRNLDLPTIWLLYSKLLCWEAAGNHNISVFPAADISQAWRDGFLAIKDKRSLTKKMIENATEVFKNLIEKIRLCTKLMNKIDNLENTLTSLNKTIDALDLKNSNSAVLISSLHNTIREGREEILAQINTAAQKNQDYLKSISSLQNEKSELATQIEELTGSNHRLHSAIEELKSQMEDTTLLSQPEVQKISLLLSSQEKNHVSELKVIKAKLSQAETVLQQKKSQIDTLKYKATEIESKASHIGLVTQNMATQIEDLQEMNKSLLKEKSSVTLAMEFEKKTNLELSNHINDMESSLNTLQTANIKAIADEANGLIIIDELKKTNADLVRESFNINKDNQRLKRRLSHSESHSLVPDEKNVYHSKRHKHDDSGEKEVRNLPDADKVKEHRHSLKGSDSDAVHSWREKDRHPSRHKESRDTHTSASHKEKEKVHSSRHKVSYARHSSSSHRENEEKDSSKHIKDDMNQSRHSKDASSTNQSINETKPLNKKQKTAAAENTQLLQEKNTSLQLQLSLTRMELQNAQNTNASYADIFKNKDMNLSRANSIIAALKLELSSSKRRFPNLEKRQKELENELKDSKQKCDESQAEIDTLKQYDFLSSHVGLTNSLSSSSLSSAASVYSSYPLSFSPFLSPISPSFPESKKPALHLQSPNLSPLMSNSIFTGMVKTENHNNSHLSAPEIPPNLMI
jgi:hypothetical protein